MIRLVLALTAAFALPAFAQKPGKPWTPSTTVAGKIDFMGEAVDQKPRAKMQTASLRRAQRRR